MKQQFDLQKHIEQGVEAIVADTLKATLKNPRESAFMAKFALASRKASKKRMDLEREGLHVPGFLIASITSSCNLHCAGCYSRCNNATNDEPPVEQLTSGEWLRIFREADELGVSFIMLAGGEPMIRRDIIETLKKDIKNGLPEDVEKDAEATMQKSHDKFIKLVDDLYKDKDAEIMAV